MHVSLCLEASSRSTSIAQGIHIPTRFCRHMLYSCGLQGTCKGFRPSNNSLTMSSGGLNGHSANHRVDPRRIALTGSSAGGNLAAALTLLCIHRPLPNNARIVGLGLNYPVLDASTPYVSKLSGIDAKIVLPPWFSRFILHAYLPPRSVRDPYVSPFQASREDLQRFPTTAIVTASQDYLSTEGDAFARTLKECGVRVTHRRFEEVGHAFDLMPTLDWARRRRNKKATKEAYDMFVQAFMDLLQ